MDRKNRVEINLKASMCVENPTGSDIYAWGDPEAQHVKNNGIEREGGVTNLYEQETTFTTPGLQSLITKSGDLLQVDSSHNVRINDTVLGNVGSLAVSNRNAIKGYSDAAWSASNTIIGIVKIGTAIRVDEINPATMAVINTRSTTFTMPTVAVTNVILVKYVGMNFSDQLRFILSNNSVTIVLNEAGSVVSGISGSLTWTQRTLENNSWWGCAYSDALGIFAAVGSGPTHYASSSTDGVTWATQTIEGNIWKAVAWSPELALFVTVGNGVTHYAATSVDGINWTTRTLAAGNWESVAWSSQLGIFVAVASSGANRAATSSDGVVWNTQTIEADAWWGVTWAASLGLFVAVGAGGAGHYVATSTNGTSWSTGTMDSGAWRKVVWSPQKALFVAVGEGVSHYVATSTNGSVWTTGVITSGNWDDVAWSPELGIFLAVRYIGGVGVHSATSVDGFTWIYDSTMPTITPVKVVWSAQLFMFVVMGSGANGVVTGIPAIKGISWGWKFDTQKYLIGTQGTAGSFYIGDLDGTVTAITDATWAVIDQFAGTAYSRAILTFNVKKNGSNLLTGIGEVGQNQAGTYSASPTYYGVALAAVTVTITNNVSGPGYAEATFTRSDTGTAIFYYQAPIMGHNPSAWHDYQQSQTQTLCNGYGRLSDFNGNTLGNTCSLRVVMISSQPSFLSAGIIGNSSRSPVDNLGVPVTNVGEFDEFFVPHVVDNGSTQLACIYRNAGILFFLVITSGAVNTLQAVSDNVYMVNCLSPVNAVDVTNMTLNLGVNDYNGRILFRSVAAIISTVQIVGMMQGPYSNSVDPGVKLITQTFSAATSLIPGIELPSFIDRAVFSYGVNIYASTTAPVYSLTYQNFNVSYVNGDLSGVEYVPDSRVPFAMGYVFSYHTMHTEIETIFTGVGVTGSGDINYDYVGYETGNDIQGQYESFNLYGQTYMFDGLNIWLSGFSGSLFSGKGNAPIATAPGMTLLAVSPNSAFFLSAFDNSVWSFNGGRSLTKLQRFNSLAAITDGIYNTRDGALLMQTANEFIWVRDSVISVNPRKSNQTSTSLYSTALGAFAANNTLSWRYSWNAIGSVVALDFQSAYFGLEKNVKTNLTGVVITFYSPTRAALTLNCTVSTFDTDTYNVQTDSFDIVPSDYTDLNLTRVRIRPQVQKALATSIGVACPSKVLLVDMIPEFTEDVAALQSGTRSK